jgi:hypothetical protein
MSKAQSDTLNHLGFQLSMLRLAHQADVHEPAPVAGLNLVQIKQLAELADRVPVPVRLRAV